MLQTMYSAGQKSSQNQYPFEMPSNCLHYQEKFLRHQKRWCYQRHFQLNLGKLKTEKILTVKILRHLIVHAPPWQFLFFAESTCLSDCSILLGHSSITFCDWCSNFFFIKYQSRLLLSHSIVAWMATTLLIIDFILTFYYDVIGSEFDPFISLFIANYVWQISLEERLLLSLAALVSSYYRRFLFRDLLLVWRNWS